MAGQVIVGAGAVGTAVARLLAQLLRSDRFPRWLATAALEGLPAGPALRSTAGRVRRVRCRLGRGRGQ